MKKPPVIYRSKHDKDIAAEPEMVELKRMIRSGELSAGRTSEYLKGHIHEEDDPSN